jgi:hypothetical protein
MRSPNFLTKLLSTAAAAVATLALPGIASAQARPTDPSTLDILGVLVEKGVLTRQDADAVLTEARKRSEANADVVRVPYVPEAIRNQIRDEVKAEVVATAKSEGWAQPGALPGWLDRFTFSGDLRVRGERQDFGADNTPLILDINRINDDGDYLVGAVLPLRSTTENRYRARTRARFAVDARVNDYVQAGIRITTGNLADPVSTNETLTGNFDRFTGGLDRAYIRVSPFAKDARFGKSNIVFGKFDNPFFSTELLFDRDLQFDGVAGTINARFGDDDDAPALFLTGGAFPLEEFDFNKDDRFLFAGQIGASVSPVPGVRLKAAAALYKYTNTQGRFNTVGTRDNDYTAASRVQFGNSTFNIRRDGGLTNSYLFGLASKFRIGAATARAEFDINPTLVAAVDLEALKNFAYDADKMAAMGLLPSSGDTAWHARLSLGHAKVDERNAWSVNAGYRRLEGDSTLDLFTDSDFGLGGTDQKGFVVQGLYGLGKNLWIAGSWYSARTINLSDARTGLVAPPVDLDTFQIDLNVKF